MLIDHDEEERVLLHNPSPTPRFLSYPKDSVLAAKMGSQLTPEMDRSFLSETFSVKALGSNCKLPCEIPPVMSILR